MPTIHNETDSLHLKTPRIGGFTLLEPLSEGSCGLVYKARQDRVGRMVALKLLPEWPPATDVALERFNRAAYVNAQVCHPNLLTLFDFGTVDGYHFTSMELVSGQPLQKHLAQNGPLDELFALKLAQQILGALVALHSREICHRNIKPKNIFIEVNGKARLIGLGLASCKSAFFSPHLDARPIGTPHFMAPEMIRGSFADPRSDLYSVGVTLFVATTGRTPFEKGSPMAVMSKHLTETPVSLNDARPTLSKEFCAFVDMLMARDLETRFQSAKAALDICDALVARRAPPEAGVKKESLPPILLVPRATSRGSVRKIAQKASAWMHHPAVVILSSAVVTVLMLVGLTYALKTWSNDSAKPTNAVQQSNGLSSDEREMLRLSRSDELFQRSPALGVSEWNHFLQQYPNASSASQKYARDRIDVYARLLRTPDTTQDRVRRNNLPAEQNEF